MKLRNILGGASAMLGLIAAQPAWAQSSDSGSIDVVANLELVQAQVDILGVAPVQFGTLGIPNGTLPGSECRYIMTAVDNFNVQNLASQVEVRDVQSNGTMVISDGITPSGCTTNGNKTRGIFTIRCTPGVNMFLNGEIQPGSDNAIELRNARGLVFNIGGGSPLFQFDGNNRPFTCPSEESDGISAGEMQLLVIANAYIRETARPGAGVLGSLALTVNY